MDLEFFEDVVSDNDEIALTPADMSESTLSSIVHYSTMDRFNF